MNDERLCRSTQWVVSLNTALSPSSCVVIQEEEYYHMLGRRTPAQRNNSPLLRSMSRNSSQVQVGLWQGLRSGGTANQTGLGPCKHLLGPHRQTGRVLDVDSSPDKRLHLNLE